MDERHTPARGSDVGATGAPQSESAMEAGTRAAATGAQEVAQATKQEARVVAGEVSTQASRVMSDARHHLRGVAEEQQTAAVKRLRLTADELQEMSEGRSDSPARTMVAALAERSRRIAEHLETRGPDGVLTEIQEFARRRPGTFLLAALGAGFVVGRLGRGVLTAPNGTESDAGTPSRWVPGDPSMSPAPLSEPDTSLPPVTAGGPPQSTTYRSGAAGPPPTTGGRP
jgi:hypothetical protein